MARALDRQRAKMASQGYVSPAAVAEKLCVDVDGIYRLVQAKKLRAVKVGRYWYVELQSVVEHVGPEAAALLGLRSSSD